MRALNIDTERDRRHAIEHLQRIPLRKLTVTFATQKSNRSLAQNRLFWSWMQVLSDETGHTAQEMHDYLVEEFCPMETKEIMGKVVTQHRGTSKLRVQEFSDLLNTIDAWASGDLGIYLPKPEDQYYEAMGLKRRQE